YLTSQWDSRDFYGGPPYDKNVRAEGKVVIVTGATSGIGREAAWDFARRGAKVFMACRNMEKCEEVRRDIVLESSNKFVYCRPCDLASTESIRKFVERFKSEEPQVHVLVNNAGVMEPPASVTRDGFETQLGVNHLGHFLLTNLLLDTLKKYDAPAAYAQSKLANLLFVRELGRRMLVRDDYTHQSNKKLKNNKRFPVLYIRQEGTKLLLGGNSDHDTASTARA
ncbi:hypothetical protein HF086_009659, partial [Spodoptera exigua]